MRLYTLVDQPFDEVKADLLTDGDSAVPQITQLEHDAMAAHALLQAMDEQLAKHWTVVSDPAKRALLDARERAAKILAGWLREE